MANNDKLYTQALSNGTNASTKNDYWTRNYNDGSMTHYINGKGYNVMANDSLGRWNAANTAYTEQNGGVAATGTINNPTGYQQSKSIYDQSYGNQTKAAQGQIDAAVGTLNTSLNKSNATYDNAQKAAYTNYMMGQKGMAQQLAASGLGKTGASESTRLAAITDYNNQYNNNESARATAAQDIYNQIAQTKANGASTLANLEANYGDKLAGAYQTSLGNDVNQQNADRDYQANQRQQNTENLYDIFDRVISQYGTGRTAYNILKQIYPNIKESDFNYYALDRGNAISGQLKTQQGYNN